MKMFDILFPTYSCLVCRTEINKSKHVFICDACEKKLPRHEKICDKCGSEVSVYAFVCDRCQTGASVALPAQTQKPALSPASDTFRGSKNIRWHFDKARSAFSYEKPIIELVLRLKYNAEGDIAKFAAPMLAEAVVKYNIVADLIIPVPLASKRFKERGYNQSELIATKLSKITGIPVNNSFLVRVKHTEAQKKMTPKERQENLHDAFEIRPPYSVVKGKRILLIDDVLTTGATVNECARMIRCAHPESIEVLTVASVRQKPTAEG